MKLRNRAEAGRKLADKLSAYADAKDVIVLGIPRGGVPVAYEVSSALHVRLDVFLSNKLGVPGNEELAFGALAAGDGRYLDERTIEASGISAEQIEQITQATIRRLAERDRLFRNGRPPIEITGRTVILIDDGIATGASVYAAIQALLEMKPAKLVVAAPVAPASTCEWLRSVVDELVTLVAPTTFYAVGQFYEHFDQVSDEEVVKLLRLPDSTS
jgi:putative phosphoribosyl transferase